MWKWITPAVLAAVLGGIAAPGRVSADDRYYTDQDGHRYTREGDRYYRDGHWYYREGNRYYRVDNRTDRDYRDYRTDRYSRSRRYSRNSGSASDLTDRASTIRDRVERLYREHKLSRSHRDEARDHLERIWNDRDRGALHGDRVSADHDWLDQVENTVNNWSHGAYFERWGRSR